MMFSHLIAHPQHLLLKCISGSRAYNLALPSSDTDIKGIFVLPQRELYGLTYTPQVSNETNDEVYYEAGRFIDLLVKNNPNILELLSTPEDCVLYRHPLMDLIRPEDFLSKLCLDSFAGYAKTQIKKARGLNKKINLSFERQRKSILEFCHVVVDKGTQSLPAWLAKKNFAAADCGLVRLSHFRDAYVLFHRSQLAESHPPPCTRPGTQPPGSYPPQSQSPESQPPGSNPPQSHPPGTPQPESSPIKGIISSETANDVQLSPIPAGIAPLTVMHFNKDGYSMYCKDYASYWEWVDERNEARYENTLAHGKNYDAKNLMHTFRLLAMAAEIATQHRVNVHRHDRDFLLRIRSGEFEYTTLLEMVEEKMTGIEALYAKSDLPDAPDPAHAEALLVHIRERFYQAG